MKSKKTIAFFAVLMGSFLLSACGEEFGASSWPGLTLDEASNTLYVAYNTQVYALQAENGVERWRYPTEPDNAITFYAAPALTEDGQVLAGAYNNILYSLDPQRNGQLNWSFELALNRYLGSPQTVGGNIYAPNADRLIYALDSNGELLWAFRANDALWAQPATDGATLFAPSVDHVLHAVDTSSGDEIWDLDVGGPVVGNPALDEGGTLYVGTFGAEVVAVDSASGRVEWRATTANWVWGGPAVDEGVVYAADLDGFVYAFDAETGNQMWQVATNGAITGTPLVANEHIYVGTENGELVSITLDGRIQWRQSVEGQIHGPPVAAGDLILFGLVEADPIVMAVDLNGQIQWSFIP